MKEITYIVNTGSLRIRNSNEEPKLIYKECNNGILLKLIVAESKLEDVLEAIKGSLPDDVLAALGIMASGEDLGEISQELRKQGYKCEVKREELENDYCETLEVDLSREREKKSNLIKVIIEGESIRTKPYKGESKYLLYEREGNGWRAEAAIEYSELEKLYNVDDRLVALVDLLMPGLGTCVEEPERVLRYLREKVGSYAFQTVRDEDYYHLYVEF